MVAHADAGGFTDTDDLVATGLSSLDMKKLAQLVHQGGAAAAAAVAEQDVETAAWRAVEEGVKLRHRFHLCAWKVQTGCDFADRLI